MLPSSRSDTLCKTKVQLVPDFQNKCMKYKFKKSFTTVRFSILLLTPVAWTAEMGSIAKPTFHLEKSLQVHQPRQPPPITLYIVTSKKTPSTFQKKKRPTYFCIFSVFSTLNQIIWLIHSTLVHLHPPLLLV